LTLSASKLSFKLLYINLRLHLTISSFGNIAPAIFTSKIFSFPLKTEETPRGIYTEHELYTIASIVFASIFYKVEPTMAFPYGLVSRQATEQIGKLIEGVVQAVKSPGIISGILHHHEQNQSPLKEYGVQFIKDMISSGKSVKDIALRQVWPISGATMTNQALLVSLVVCYISVSVLTKTIQFAQSLDYFLGPGKQYLPELYRLARLDTKDSDSLILHYALEGVRLGSASGSYRIASKPTEINDNGGKVSVDSGDSVFVSFLSAGQDSTIFPEPETVRTDRNLDTYLYYFSGPQIGLGKDVNFIALTRLLKRVFALKNLRRATGPQGILQKIPQDGGLSAYLREDSASYVPFPTTLKINWDDE
jgi:linoleate 10R-lipoxygenase